MANPHTFRAIRSGVEAMPGGDIARHYHREGYANVILSGSFIEAAFAGRSAVRPGDVLLHGAFDAHADVNVSRLGPCILRLPWHDVGVEGHFRVRDPDGLARLAEVDPIAASERLRESLQPVPTIARHWSDQLAHDLLTERALNIRQWAERHDLAPETASRGFHRRFGVTPKLFRLEGRTRAAWRVIVTTDHSLTSVAYDTGFADLAHMSRSISMLTGVSPRHWRAMRRTGPQQAR
jgi:AraC-like DNA-binding protein